MTTMDFTPKDIADAYAMAAAAHGGQTDDFDGAPYLHHVIEVARQVRDAGAIYEIVAALHDTLEQTALTRDEITERFGGAVSGAVLALSRARREDYFGSYLPRVLANPIAQTVKAADARANLAKAHALQDTASRAKAVSKYTAVLDQLARATATDHGEGGFGAISFDTAFRYTRTAQPGEIDGNGHVNNAVYVRWLQDAGVTHWQKIAPREYLTEVVWICLRHEIDYRTPVFAGERVTVHTWLGARRGPRFDRHVDIRHTNKEKPVIRAVTTWAMIDRETGRPRRIPDSLLAAIGLPTVSTPDSGGDKSLEGGRI